MMGILSVLARKVNLRSTEEAADGLIRGGKSMYVHTTELEWCYERGGNPTKMFTNDLAGGKKRSGSQNGQGKETFP